MGGGPSAVSEDVAEDAEDEGGSGCLASPMRWPQAGWSRRVVAWPLDVESRRFFSFYFSGHAH